MNFCYKVGIVATYTGAILWRLFIRLDSPRYPLRTYADMAERIFGKPARYIVTFLQSLQLLITVCLYYFFTLGFRENVKLYIYRSPLSFWLTAKRCLSWRRERYLFVVAAVDSIMMVHTAQALFLCVYYNLDDRGPRPRTNPYFESESVVHLYKCLLSC